MRTMNTIQRMAETGRYAISDASLWPEGSSRKISSKVNSPVVIVIVFSSDRGGSENGERYMYERGIDLITSTQLTIHFLCSFTAYYNSLVGH